MQDKYIYLGRCINITCELRGQEIKFPMSDDKKAEEFAHRPPSCQKCGCFLRGDLKLKPEE